MFSLADALRRHDAVESRLTAPVSERMLDLANLCPGMRVLDLASGCGEPAVRAARRVGPTGSVLGIDLSEAVLAVAREKAEREAISNLELRVGDAESPEGLAEASFDAATARWGWMNMRAVANVRRVLVPGGPFVAAFWAEPQRVAWAMLSRRVLARYRDVPAIDPEAPGTFRYAELSRIESDFRAAGFRVEHVEEMAIPVCEAQTGAGIAAWIRDFGLGRFADELPEHDRLRYEADLVREAEQLRRDGMIRLEGVTRLVRAR